MPKNLMRGNMNGIRKRGRRRKRIKNFEKALKAMGVWNWKERSIDSWRLILKEAKVLALRK